MKSIANTLRACLLASAVVAALGLTACSQSQSPPAAPGLDAAAAPAPAADAVQEPRWRDLADNSLRPIVFNPYSWRGAA